MCCEDAPTMDGAMERAATDFKLSHVGHITQLFTDCRVCKVLQDIKDKASVRAAAKCQKKPATINAHV
jgi:hypothetical protein